MPQTITGREAEVPQNNKTVIDSAVFRFFVPGELDLWPLASKFELGQDFCTVHLTAKFCHPTFNHSEVVVRTNKQLSVNVPFQTYPRLLTCSTQMVLTWALYCIVGLLPTLGSRKAKEQGYCCRHLRICRRQHKEKAGMTNSEIGFQTVSDDWWINVNVY